MPKITKNTLKKHLETLEKEELIHEVLRLYEKIKAVKDFYEMDLGTDTNAVLNEYKAKIEKQYFPKRGYGNPKASEVRKVISDFKKIAAFEFDVVDLLIFRVEQAVRFTNAYGDIDEQFYTSAENAFDDALKLAKKTASLAHIRDRAFCIVKETENIGWGFHDTLFSTFTEYFGEEPYIPSWRR
ncbi:MAG: hypothetical protein EAZ70_02630 [Runella slithyformis]|nr:MAG: hypothetical protein EAY79_02280 [Runella slithyformis]TAF95199.1 MAG: hypothetical protein EAZ46_08350 [Runella sp.]TAG17654.1 MAG: hypothetical protein EAZ38_16980 [Cytophagales bacterium]TAG40039.1 MAG: hypothetical protein EAZ32_07965 [Cytophagia bacterium]TAF29348.1 MAG: hypothetical protein EAZ70_02630 [Runella slithyformis]